MSVSRLQETLDSGKFAVTAEIGPPRSCETERLREMARMLKGSAHAFNLTDNQAANVRMSSIASSVICLQEGLEPVMQMTADRNRIAMQSDVIGASALGVRTCRASAATTSVGNHPQARTCDLDSSGAYGAAPAQGGKSGRGGAAGTAAAVSRGGQSRRSFGSTWPGWRRRTPGRGSCDPCPGPGLPRFGPGRGEGLHEKVHIMAGALRCIAGKPIYEQGGRDERSRATVDEAASDREEGIRLCVETINELSPSKGCRGA